MTQLQKNAALLGVLALIATGVGLYAWYGVKAPSEREEAKKESDAQLISFGEGAAQAKESVKLSKVVVTAKGDTTTLERQDDRWRITAPVNAGVDQVAVDGLVSQLTTGRFKHVIEEKPTAEDLERYGLNAPSFTVTATASANGDTRQFAIKGGVENTFDGSVYVQRDDDPTVYSVQGGLRWNLDKSTFELRDKQVLSVPEKEVTKVEVKAPANQYALEQVSDEKWRITAPQAAADADKDAVTGLLTGLKNHRASAFLSDSPEARTKAGLDKPIATATFAIQGKDPVQLSFGKADGKVHVLRTDGTQTTLAEVPEAAITALDKNALDLRDKSLLSFKKEDVTTVAFTRGSDRLVVQREGTDDWKLVSPKEGKAQKFKVTSILWTLGSLKATVFGEEKPKSWSKYGLDKPERSIELSGKDGKVIAALRVGKKVEGEETLHYARGSRDQVMQLDTARLSELPTTADDLLEALPVATPTKAP